MNHNRCDNSIATAISGSDYGSIVSDSKKISNSPLFGANQQEFEISRFSCLLRSTDEKDKYVCPNCGKHNFSVSSNGKGYKCFNGECSVKLPLLRSSYDSFGMARTTASPILLRNNKATYFYPNGNRVERFLNNKGKKQCIPHENGIQGKSSKWCPYRSDILDNKDRWIFAAEGEKCVEALIDQGYKAVTWCGAGKDWDFILEDARRLYSQGLHGIVYLRDNDYDPGLLKAQKVFEAFKAAGIWIVVVNPADFKPEFNVDKFDIADLLEKADPISVFDWIRSEVIRSFQPSSTKQHFQSSTTTALKPNQISNTPAVKATPPQSIDWQSISFQYESLKSDRQKEEFKVNVCRQFGISSYDLNRVFSANDFIDDEAIGSEVSLVLQKSDLDLSDFLPQYLAEAVKQYCKFQKINQSVALTLLLATISSLHRPGTKCWLHKGLGFSVPPTLYTAVVAESGAKKSPILREISNNPLRRIRRQQMEDFAEELNQFNSLNPEEAAKSKPPQEPAAMFISDATTEGIKGFAAQHHNKSILLKVDEVSSLFYGQNAYRGGRGGDRQFYLEAFDASGFSVLRAGGLKHEVEHLHLSIIGTIQPDVIAKIIGDNQDSDGTFARFIFCRQPNVSTTLPDLGHNVSISGLLTNIYEKILDRPVSEMGLSLDAFKEYQPFYNQCEIKRVKSPSPCERYFWGKAEGLAGRLAFNLQVLEDPKSIEISKVNICRAIKLVKFYHSELKALMVNIDPVNRISPKLARLIHLAQVLGEVTPRDVYTQYSGKDRPNAATVRQWMVKAESLGLGKILGDGRNIRFKSNDDNDDNLMISISSNQNLVQQEFQPIDDNDDKDDKSLDFFIHPKNLGDGMAYASPPPLDPKHLTYLGENKNEGNYHQYHHYHQTPETLDETEKEMMIKESSNLSSMEESEKKELEEAESFALLFMEMLDESQLTLQMMQELATEGNWSSKFKKKVMSFLSADHQKKIRKMFKPIEEGCLVYFRPSDDASEFSGVVLRASSDGIEIKSEQSKYPFLVPLNLVRHAV